MLLRETPPCRVLSFFSLLIAPYPHSLNSTASVYYLMERQSKQSSISFANWNLSATQLFEWDPGVRLPILMETMSTVGPYVQCRRRPRDAFKSEDGPASQEFCLFLNRRLQPWDGSIEHPANGESWRPRLSTCQGKRRSRSVVDTGFSVRHQRS